MQPNFQLPGARIIRNCYLFLTPAISKWLPMFFMISLLREAARPDRRSHTVSIPPHPPGREGAFARRRTLLQERIEDHFTDTEARCFPFRLASWASRSCQRLLRPSVPVKLGVAASVVNRICPQSNISAEPSASLCPISHISFEVSWARQCQYDDLGIFASHGSAETSIYCRRSAEAPAPYPLHHL